MIKGLFLALLIGLSVPDSGYAEQVWPIDTWTPAFDYDGTSDSVDYEPLNVAQKHWRICASYPHLKDSYWLRMRAGLAFICKSWKPVAIPTLNVKLPIFGHVQKMQMP